MKHILFLCVFNFTIAYAYDPFDSMRCQGKLMSQGTSFKTVLAQCGEPEYSHKSGNQYATYIRVTYSPNNRGKYVMLFEDGLLIKSKLIVYGAKNIKWQNPY